IEGWERASAISASNARCRRSSSARCACMDMLGGSPQSDCYLTPEVYTVLTHFRSGFRLCNAAIPPQSTGLNTDRQKRILFSRFWGSALGGTDLGLAWGSVVHDCLPAMAGPGIGLARTPRGQVGDQVGGGRCGGQRPQSALLETSSDAKPARAARAFAAAQAPA